MIQLFPLRPVQIVDLSFQLMRKRFVYSFLIAMIVSLPLQAIIWIIEISAASQNTSEDLTMRTVLLAIIFQFSAIGISLSLISNLLSKTVGKVYCNQVFNNIYEVHSSPARFVVGIYHVGVQFSFLFGMIGFRFLLGQIFVDYRANLFTGLVLFLAGVPWIFLTLRFGFSVPISTHEGGSFSSILKRTKQINRVHYFKLLGVYIICLLLIFILIFPSLTMIQLFLANGIIKSDLGDWALFNLIMSVIVSTISVVYSHILTVTYFNARIEHEGFDISVSLQQLEMQGGVHGKLLDPVA